jgi:hypothetical protein
MKSRPWTAKILFRSATIFALSFLGLQNPTYAATPAKQVGSKQSLILKNGKVFGNEVQKPQGPRTGGGGNACALAISQNSKKLIAVLRSLPDLIDGKEMEKLTTEMETAEFYLSDKLMIGREKKDAINYPEENKILVTPKLCRTELIEVSGRAMAILFHEYLGLAVINDDDYRISGQFLEKYAELVNTSMVLQQSSNNLALARAALQGFLKQANDPKSKIGKHLIQLNEESKDGRNQEGTIDFPITRENIQMVVTSEETMYVPWHYANIKNNTCYAGGDSATYAIYLTQSAGVHYAAEFSTLEFSISAKQSYTMKILKPSKDLNCEQAIRGEEPSPEDETFGEVRKKYRASEAEIVKVGLD